MRNRFKFPLTVDEYEKLYEDGPLSEDFNTELLQEMPRSPLLLIHFADSADEFDAVLRGTRAEAGPVPEFWYVDLAGDRVLVFREPDASGWRVRSVLAPGQVAVANRVPGIELSVDRLLARER